MRTLFAAAVFISIFAVVLPTMAIASDIETYGAPAKDPSESTEIMVFTPLQQTIANIKHDAIEQVRALNDQLLSSAPGSSEVRQLELQIQTTKRHSEIAILQAIQADALDRGDRKIMHEAELALDQLLHPENYPVQTFPSNRPAPAGR